MKNALRASIGAVLVLAVVGVGVVAVSLGKIVKTAVEAAGPKFLGVPVTVDAVVLSPWSGRGTVRGLTIGNPQGFKTAHAVKVGEVSVALTLSSLLTDTVVVESVEVRAPDINWEIGGGDSNLQRLQKAAADSAARYGGGSAPAPKAPEKKGKSLLIRDFSVTGGRVGLAATALGGRGLTAALPDIHLKNLGGKGRSPAEAVSEAVSEVTKSAQTAAAAAGQQALEQVRKNAGALLGSFLQGLKR